MTEQTEEQPPILPPPPTPVELLLDKLEGIFPDPPEAKPGSPGWGLLQLMGHNQLYGFVMESELAGLRVLRIVSPADASGRWQELGKYSPGAVYGFTPSTKRQVLESLFWVSDALRRARTGQLALRAPEPLDADEDDLEDLDDGDRFDDFEAPGIRAELAAAEKKLAEQTERADKAEAQLKRYQDAAQPEAVKRLEDILHDANTNMDSPDANVLCKALADALDVVRAQGCELRRVLHEPPPTSYVEFKRRHRLDAIAAARPQTSAQFDILRVFSDWHVRDAAGDRLQLPEQFCVASFEDLNRAVLCDLTGRVIDTVDIDQIVQFVGVAAQLNPPNEKPKAAAPAADEEVPDWVTNK